MSNSEIQHDPVENEEQEIPEFFFTMTYPHRWSGGPDMLSLDPDTWRPIESLEEAKAIAKAKRVGGYGDDRCETSYGVRYIPKNRKHN